MALRQSPGVENRRNVFMPLWAEEDMGKGGSIYPITCAKMHIHKRMNPFFFPYFSLFGARELGPVVVCYK